MNLRLLLFLTFTITLLSCDNRAIYFKKKVNAYITEIYISSVYSDKTDPKTDFFLISENGYTLCASNTSLKGAKTFPVTFFTDCSIPNNNRIYSIEIKDNDTLVGEPIRFNINDLLDKTLINNNDSYPTYHTYENSELRVRLKFRWEDYSNNPVE